MIYRGVLRLILFTLVTMTFFMLAGGHLHVMWQPFELLMVAGIYAVAFVGSGIKLYPFDSSSENIKRIQAAGRVGFTASFIVPMVLGLIQSLAYLFRGSELVGHMVAASFVGMVYAVAFQFSFFPVLEAAKHPGAPETDRFKKIKAIAVPLFAGIGALGSVMFIALMLIVVFERPSTPQYSQAQWDAISKAHASVDKEILDLECTKGERVSSEVRESLEDAAKYRALASVKAD